MVFFQCSSTFKASGCSSALPPAVNVLQQRPWVTGSKAWCKPPANGYQDPWVTFWWRRGSTVYVCIYLWECSQCVEGRRGKRWGRQKQSWVAGWGKFVRENSQSKIKKEWETNRETQAHWPGKRRVKVRNQIDSPAINVTLWNNSQPTPHLYLHHLFNLKAFLSASHSIAPSVHLYLYVLMSLSFIFRCVFLHLCVSILTSVLFPKPIKCCLQLSSSLCFPWSQTAAFGVCMRVCACSSWGLKGGLISLHKFWCFLLHSCCQHSLHTYTQVQAHTLGSCTYTH